MQSIHIRLLGYKLYTITPKESILTALTVTLKLPDDLKNWCIAPTFHTSLICKHEANNNDLFPCGKAKAFYDFGLNNKEEWLVDEILSH